MTGWKAVLRDVSIDYNLETTPLEIRSGSDLGSTSRVYVIFHTSQGYSTGPVQFKLEFASPPRYYNYGCNNKWTNFTTDLPTAKVKVWRITVIRSSDAAGLQILCNGEEVMNTVYSDSTCISSSWKMYWKRDIIAKIQFSSGDTMSDYYRPYQPGN